MAELKLGVVVRHRGSGHIGTVSEITPAKIPGWGPSFKTIDRAMEGVWEGPYWEIVPSDQQEASKQPTPTAAEIAEARKALPSAIKYLVGMGWDGYEKLAVLLAALDAAEARATAAEERAESVHASWSKCLKLLATAERERDEARAALVAIQERRFPIMHGPSIRWSVLAPHEKQAMRNHSQTLAQLADRGGLDPIEAMAVYEDHEYPRGMCGDQATAMRAAWRALVDRTDAQAKEAPRG